MNWRINNDMEISEPLVKIKHFLLSLQRSASICLSMSCDLLRASRASRAAARSLLQLFLSSCLSSGQVLARGRDCCPVAFSEQGSDCGLLRNRVLGTLDGGGSKMEPRLLNPCFRRVAYDGVGSALNMAMRSSWSWLTSLMASRLV